MSKIKFNKEWYINNRVAVNCKTKEESKRFIIELAKIIGIAHWFDKGTYYCSHEYGEETCYSLGDKIVSDTKSVYIKNWFLIINFSDLEFEDKTRVLANNFKTLGEDYGITSLTTDIPIKRTILRENVKLKSGDIIGVDDIGKETIGLITEDYVIYNTGLHSSLKDIWYTIDNILLWYIPREELKDKSFEVSRTLFKGEINKLKDLIIHIQDKPKEIKTRTVEVFSVKFCKTESGLSHYISDSEEIFVEDIVSPIRGEYEDLYGEVINIQCKELSEEELKSYNKIIKIK